MSAVVKKEDIESTKKIVMAVDKLAVFITDAVKHGWKSMYIFTLMQMVSDIMQLIQEGKEIMPELKDLDKEEVEELSGMVYSMVKDIIDIVKEK